MKTGLRAKANLACKRERRPKEKKGDKARESWPDCAVRKILSAKGGARNFVERQIAARARKDYKKGNQRVGKAQLVAFSIRCYGKKGGRQG